MSDRREEILLRLMAILGGIAGIRKVARNSDEINERLRPAVSLFDGSEEAASETRPKQRSIAPPVPMVMTPDIVLLMGDSAADIGSAVNAMRAKIVKAVQTDTELAQLTTNGDGVAYLGCETNLERGRESEAEIALFFAVPYMLFPENL